LESDLPPVPFGESCSLSSLLLLLLLPFPVFPRRIRFALLTPYDPPMRLFVVCARLDFFFAWQFLEFHPVRLQVGWRILIPCSREQKKKNEAF
jgi:hypothetical protein